MLKNAVEHYKNKVLNFEESVLFLTKYTNTKQRMIRCETLLKRKFIDLIVNNKEAPHRKWSTETSSGKTGHFYFEDANYLMMLPMGVKVKKEAKSMSGSYRRYCWCRYSVLWMAVTALLYAMKSTDEELNF